MNNEAMMDRFFAGEVGQKILKESTDESLASRRYLVAEIEKEKNLIRDCSLPGEIEKLLQKRNKAKAAFQDAEAAYCQAEAKLTRFSTLNYRKTKELEAELAIASPEFIQTCINKLLQKREQAGTLCHIASVKAGKLVEHVASWRYLTKSFDEMAAEFKEIELKHKDALAIEPPREVAKVMYR